MNAACRCGNGASFPPFSSEGLLTIFNGEYKEFARHAAWGGAPERGGRGCAVLAAALAVEIYHANNYG